MPSSEGCLGRMVQVHIVSAVRLRRWAISGLSKAHLAVYRVTRGRPRLGGRNAGASAHHNRSAVRKGAHDTAHVLSGCDRLRGDRIERRRGPTTRLVAQPAADTARGRRDPHRQLAVTARRASDKERERLWVVIGDLRRLRPLPRTDNATHTRGASHPSKANARALGCGSHARTRKLDE